MNKIEILTEHAQKFITSDEIHAIAKKHNLIVIEDGAQVISGKYKPSSDTKTHLELYKNRKRNCCNFI